MRVFEKVCYSWEFQSGCFEEAESRVAKFDKIDKTHVGKLTRSEYIASQSDAAVATARFDKMDSNKDDVLTREEYTNQSGKKSKSE